jgi:hypothetical protein
MELVSPALVNWLAVAAMVVGTAVAAWFALGLYGVRNRKEETELAEAELPGHSHEVMSGIPPVLVAFFIVMGASLLFYILFVWLGGITY